MSSGSPRGFRAAPPYCIEFDTTGAAVLSEKYYEYWPDREPEYAPTWRPISRHQPRGSRAAPAAHLRHAPLLR